ncbi:carboxypeptidase-like regulatory domain-containing protein [Rhodohalobacter sp.]|uniref:carboxypeptidase-like regulatory domain-containing protein n=1 Tax=Rhodohalobacter sp. TaxID=1974210 RepID=UPI002ACED875|nr:carboxypeptidase-like regulatory domain-containing protein [Rhodohalobacter sp.]MDZ7755596.1 carboxypeptidase-like regulatory domain-containing protein [Rhodohalobacter sp.]
MKNLIYLPVAALIFLLAGTEAFAQTVISGKVLSADGSLIPKAEVSTIIPGIKDIFTDKQIRVEVAEDGAYRLQLDQPGIYSLTVRGVFHHTMYIPVLVYDQPSMEINVLMLPKAYKDGRHFGNEGYLQWIRVLGNFNDYDFHSGEEFTLNKDGSISTMVPVTSDTMRIQVSGLNYGMGTSAITPADRYEQLSDNSFVSVLYKNLPADSLEIRYIPNETIPYRRTVLEDRTPNSLPIDGFLAFRNDHDRYWVEPLIAMRSIPFRYRIVDYSFSEGIPPTDQLEFQNSEIESFFDVDWRRSIDEITGALKNSSLHEQQVNLLLVAYVGVAHRANMSRDYLKSIRGNDKLPEFEYNPEIIERIFEEVEPGHTVWARSSQIPLFLMDLQQFDERSVAYFTDLVRNHNSDDLAVRVSQAIVERTAQNYTSVDQMPVYQAILQRFGEGNALLRAEMIFEKQHRSD